MENCSSNSENHSSWIIDGGYSPKHYKGVLSYKEVPVDTLSQLT